MSEGRSGPVLSSLSLAGRAWGEVRRLHAFDKRRHTVPDQVNVATSSFLGRLCAHEIGEDGEELFQSVRQHFGYKRKDLALFAEGGMAQLKTKDFLLEIRCELDEADPARYFIETELKKVASRELIEEEAFSRSVGSRFDRLRLGLSGGVAVESVIDAVEDDESGALAVQYPSDCQHCLVSIEGVGGEVFIDGSLLEIRYGSLTTAAGLMEAFEAVKGHFEGAIDLGDLLK